MPSSTAERPAANVDADIQVADESVIISYSLTNTGEQPITVLDPTPPYVTGDDDQIVVSQQVFPRPDTDRKTWETSATTAATTVAAGETVHGKVSVPRPFVRLHPYGNDIGYGEIDLPSDPDSVRFCLGVIATPLVGGDTRDGGDGLLVVNDDSTFERQYLYCSDPAALD